MIIQNILKLFKTATLKQTTITYSGTIINGILGFLFYTVLAKNLGPANFGIITVSITVLTLLGDIFDLGTNTGIVRFVPKSWTENKEDAFRFLKLSLLIKLISGIVLLSLAFIAAPLIAANIFQKPELIWPLKLSFIGAVGMLLFTYTTASLQALQKFFAWSFINIITNFFRLVIVLLLVWVSMLNVSSSLLTTILLPMFGFLLALFILPTRKIFKASNLKTVWPELFKYNFQIALFTIIAAFSSRVDTFLITKMLSAADIGLYGIASQWNLVLPQLVGALGVVVAPKFASYTDKKQMLVYFKKLQILVLGLAAIFLFGIPLGYFLIPVILGTEYILSIPIFSILLISNVIFLISVPVHNSIFYYFSKPKLFIYLAIIHLIIILGLGYFMIINFGISGMALTVLFGTIINFLIPLLWFLKKLKQ